MSGLCKDCKWWERNSMVYDRLRPYGQCGLATNAWFIPPETRVAVVPHDSTHHLATHEDFGCNQFEAKG